jgi:hypothetical protein
MQIKFLLILLLLVSGCASKPTNNSDILSQTVSTTDHTISENSNDTNKTVSKKSILPTEDEWKGVCRKNVNEVGKAVSNTAGKNYLQSSYLFENKKIIWSVKSFSDSKCQNTVDAYRLFFKCDADPLKAMSVCRQYSLESLQSRIWKSKPMKDYAGYPNELTMNYQLILLKDNHAKLKSRNISDDGEFENQSLVK